ncbi:Uracil-DNA glycosylase [Sulfitobacter noctilucae]|uniref:UdgX family uracil-DNA binding protein n=1 Tax=Sulfitobacter noctilucae TaxID=1342302 RepID=UPI000468D45D|nr:UdgX family uracil-DNA binding protein [Sulfitobacter noctilucae]KIN74952.1 Uracil-DNA glycosylase [Sulfitobacter noctilucae]
MHTVTLPRLGTFEVWRDAARALAAAGTPPEQCSWQMEGAAASLFDTPDAPLPPAKRSVNVPKAFPQLAKQLCASRAAGAFDLAYRLLVRLSDAPRLLSNRADPDVAQAEALAKNIRRDMHKMKAFVRFRDVTPEGANRRQFLSWFEPDHRIEQLIGGFFMRRFGDMDWVIVTPEITTRFEGGKLSFEAVESARLDLSDETEELWKTYYANIFNPARLKIKAMQSEMPKKYWKNLPEATLIPGLIAQAEAKVAAMQEAAPTLPPIRAGRVLDRLHTESGDIDADLQGCARCPLAGPATQAVPGEGPMDARLMIVGEQPGDQEDLAGRPFVGPAGQLFDQIAGEAGLDRHAAYVTNAVKHFKYTVRGKRRIHQNPNADEVSHCRWWLDREIAQVQPVMLVALGATAALALTGNGKNITARRGRVEKGLAGLPVFITVHPSAVLRQPDETSRKALRGALHADLAEVSKMMAQVAVASG